MPSHPLDLSFPPLPETVMELEQLTAAGDLSTRRLCAVVQRDPIVSMQVLRRANSSYWGVRREVSDVGHATRLLGFRAVRELALVEGLRRVRESIAEGPGRDAFERVMHVSSYAAYFGQHFARAVDLPEARGRVFSAGLLHTAGRLALLHARPATYAQLCAANGQAAPLPSAAQEQHAFGVTHLKGADEACRHWGLPAGLTRLVAYYHRPCELDDRRERTLAAIVATGSHLGLLDVAGEERALPEVLQQAARADPALAGRAVRELALGAAQRAEEAVAM